MSKRKAKKAEVGNVPVSRQHPIHQSSSRSEAKSKAKDGNSSQRYFPSRNMNVQGPKGCAPGRGVSESVLGLLFFPVLAMTAVIIAWAMVVRHETPAPSYLPDAPRVQLHDARPDTRGERERLFNEQIAPVIEAASLRNTQAAHRAAAGVRTVFAGYRTGIKPFVEDLGSLGTRFQIARRMPGDWLNDDSRVQQLVLEKFEQHVFSEQDLERDLAKVMEAFREDLLAGDNRMRSECRAAIQAAAMPDLLGQTLFEPEVSRYLNLEF